MFRIREYVYRFRIRKSELRNRIWIREVDKIRIQIAVYIFLTYVRPLPSSDPILPPALIH
jgi:hypothetical protein